MHMVVGCGLHLRLIEQAQPFDLGSWLSAPLRLQVVPMCIPSLEVKWVAWHHSGFLLSLIYAQQNGQEVKSALLRSFNSL